MGKNKALAHHTSTYFHSYFFFPSFSFCNIEVGNEEWDLALYERVLYKPFVPSKLTRVHNVLVCLTFAVDFLVLVVRL